MFCRRIFCLLNCTTDTVQVIAGRVLARPGIRNPLKHSGYLMCHRVWQEELWILRNVCISVLCRDIIAHSIESPTKQKYKH
jgi:hypothetical protein